MALFYCRGVLAISQSAYVPSQPASQLASQRSQAQIQPGDTELNPKRSTNLPLSQPTQAPAPALPL